MFQDLETAAIKLGMTGEETSPSWPIEDMRYAYHSDLAARTLTNGFLRDASLTDKRLLIVYDEVTASVRDNPLSVSRQDRTKTDEFRADIDLIRSGAVDIGWSQKKKKKEEEEKRRVIDLHPRPPVSYRPALTTCYQGPAHVFHNTR